MNNKTLAAAAYILWIPSLYIVLTEKRKEDFVGFHGGQALILWTLIFLAFFLTRALVNLVWSVIYIPYLDLLEIMVASVAWGYAVACGIRSYQGAMFKIPN
ncbi:MAG: hypothetical protein PHH14_04970 [Candidatus Margulisbacteria bacterium]|nr:hypothetical protein [Candidatus Margulisiibacteriota bacterium]